MIDHKILIRLKNSSVGKFLEGVDRSNNTSIVTLWSIDALLGIRAFFLVCNCQIHLLTHALSLMNSQTHLSLQAWIGIAALEGKACAITSGNDCIIHKHIVLHNICRHSIRTLH